jgi:hypothetical protein
MPIFYIKIDTTRKNAEYIAHELIGQDTALLTSDEVIEINCLDDANDDDELRQFYRSRDN